MSLEQVSDDIVDEERAGPTAVARLSQEVTRLVRASHSLKAQLHGRHADGIEWAGYMLLFQLSTGGPQRSSTLAASACVDPSTVSRQVATLVDAGLVERRADPHDGRAILLAATDLGAARHRAIHERRDRAFARLVADWSDDDVTTLVTLLDRLNTSVLDGRAAMLDALSEPTSVPDGKTPVPDGTISGSRS
jgi:DNA-binding MarR family transcriptional regulator